jgi:tRNA1(Val) A37 N6-methylase TrmN6
MEALLGMLPPLDPDKFAFIDLGSGKGRALFLAAAYPFKRIIGVEYAPELHEIAMRNTRTYRNPARKCADIQPVCADATSFAFPLLPTVCFMNNPFGEPLIAAVATRIDESVRASPRPFFVVYLHANHTGPIDRLAGWRRITAGSLGRSPYVVWRWDGAH